MNAEARDEDVHALSSTITRTQPSTSRDIDLEPGRSSSETR
jgi:hypothetical protein